MVIHKIHLRQAIFQNVYAAWLFLSGMMSDNFSLPLKYSIV